LQPFYLCLLINLNTLLRDILLIDRKKVKLEKKKEKEKKKKGKFSQLHFSQAPLEVHTELITCYQRWTPTP
jgi:hypothetical protein